MGKLDRIFISVIIFSLAITAGVISQADQSSDHGVAVQSQVTVVTEVELVEANYRELGLSPEATVSGSKAERNLYPTTLWLLGSALLAMVGYKRMRNTSTGAN